MMKFLIKLEIFIIDDINIMKYTSLHHHELEILRGKDEKYIEIWKYFKMFKVFSVFLNSSINVEPTSFTNYQ